MSRPALSGAEPFHTALKHARPRGASLLVLLFVASTGLALAQPGAGTAATRAPDRGGLFFGQPPDPAKVRRYFVAAEPEMWDFLPSGKDDVCGTPLPPSVAAKRATSKLRYVQYTDDTFEVKLASRPSLGVLGPVLRGTVGQYLVITFLNRTAQPLSMHPHGVKYDKDSEGANYRPGAGKGASVEPGERFTYVWFLDEASGPAANELSSKGWLYHSHVNGDQEINQGLVGCIIVTDPSRARDDGTPADIDREFATLFMIFDESGMVELPGDPDEYSTPTVSGPVVQTWSQAEELRERESRYAINGRIFGNLTGLEMNQGERVRWYLFSLGSEQDFHSVHWHGLRVLDENHHRTDVIELLPASMKVADMLADNPGSWLLHCHVAEHMREGMFTKFEIYSAAQVGASRAPEEAFLGINASERVLRFSEVRWLEGTAGRLGTLVLKGKLPVPRPYPLPATALRIEIAATAIELQPAGDGEFHGAAGTFRILNRAKDDLVFGGELAFEAELLVAPEVKRSGALPISFSLGGKTWNAELRVY